MVDVAGDHEAGGTAVLQPELLEFALGSLQQLLADAVLIV